MAPLHPSRTSVAAADPDGQLTDPRRMVVKGQPDPCVLAYHLTMRLADDRGIARSPAALRHASRQLVRQSAARGLLAFRVADTHLHLLLATDRRTAGLLARSIEASLHLTLALPVPFEPARIRPVSSPRHLLSAFRYVLRQETHHGTAIDPAHDGSILPDLLGMRLIGAEAVLARARTLVPRLSSRELLDWVGVEPFDELPCDLDLVADAAAAALALASLAGQTRGAQAARLVAVHLLGRQLSAAEIASRLALSRRRVEALRQTAPDAALLQASLRQLRWRTSLRDRRLASATADFDPELRWAR